MEEKTIEQIKILYVDDEENNLSAFTATFRRDFNITTSTSAIEAKTVLEEHSFDIIISDQRMPNMTGVEFLEFVRTKYPEPIRILLTGYADIDAVIDAINRGEIYRYVTKPYINDDMKSLIETSHEVFRLRKENKQLLLDLQDANKKLEFIARQNMLS
jgi:DNA-binding NtrC family response regulator